MTIEDTCGVLIESEAVNHDSPFIESATSDQIIEVGMAGGIDALG